MRKIISIFAALLMLCALSHAEEIAPAYTVEFADVFTLEFPAAWQEQAVSPEQSDADVIACFSDGTHFISITRTDGEGEYADIDAYAQAIGDSYDSAMVSQLGVADFVCCTDTQALVSQCATLIPGAGIFTFRFYPTGDAEFARTILDIMGSFRPVEVKGQ